MKFKCLDKDGKFVGNVNGDNEQHALHAAQKINKYVVKVDLIPGQQPDAVEPEEPKKPKKQVKKAADVVAESKLD